MYMISFPHSGVVRELFRELRKNISIDQFPAVIKETVVCVEDKDAF